MTNLPKVDPSSTSAQSVESTTQNGQQTVSEPAINVPESSSAEQEAITKTSSENSKEESQTQSSDPSTSETVSLDPSKIAMNEKGEEVLKEEIERLKQEEFQRSDKLFTYSMDYPFGFRRYIAIGKMVWYVHNEAVKFISRSTRSSNIPSHLWKRIETGLVNKYGLTKHINDKGKVLYLQEELLKDSKTGYLFKAGLSSITKDYLETLNEDYKEDPEKALLFFKKYEEEARLLREEQNLKDLAPISSDYDDAGRPRLREDLLPKPV